MGASKNFTAGAECALSWSGTSMVAKSESVQASFTYDDPGESGLIGTREPADDRRIILRKDVKGAFTVPANYVEASCLLNSFFSQSGTDTDAAFTNGTARRLPPNPETNNAFTLRVDRKHASGKVFQYGSCWPSRLSVTWQESQPAEITVDVLAITEGTATATISAAGTQAPAIGADAYVTVNGTEYYCRGGEVTVDLNLDERFHNSLTRTHAQPKGAVKVTGKLDIDLNTDTWNQILRNSENRDHVPIKVRFANTTNHYGFVMNECCINNATPTISGNDVVTTSLEWQAFSDGDATVVCYNK